MTIPGARARNSRPSTGSTFPFVVRLLTRAARSAATSCTGTLAPSLLKYKNSPTTAAMSSNSPKIREEPDSELIARANLSIPYRVTDDMEKPVLPTSYLREAKRDIRIGPAGWNYRAWAGVVYPRRRATGFSEVGYIAQFFDVAEINTSFYGAVRQSTAEKWL